MTVDGADALVQALNDEQTYIAGDLASDEALLSSTPAAPDLTRLHKLLRLAMQQDDQEIINVFAWKSAQEVGRASSIYPLVISAARALSGTDGAILRTVSTGGLTASVPDTADFICVPYQLKGAKFVSADGDAVRVPGLSAGARSITSGIEVALTAGEGSRVDSMVTPAGWSPLAASAAQLAFWRFPSRPATEPELDAWNTTYARFKGSNTPGSCGSDRQAGAVTAVTPPPTPPLNAPVAPTITANYNGYVAVSQTSNATASAVEGKWKQTGFLDGTCVTKGAAYATWTGFQGPDPAGGDRLIQQGTDVATYAGATPYAWWEALAPNQHAVNEQIFSNFAVQPGDEFVSGTRIFHHDGSSSDTWYTPDGTALSFFDFDASNGMYMNMIINYNQTIPTPAGPTYAYQFFTAAASDFVTERPAFPTGLSDYRQPYYSNTEWNYEYNLYPGGAYGQKTGLAAVFMHGDKGLSYLLSGGTYAIIGTDTPVMSTSFGTGDFYSQWQGCE